MTIYIKQIDKYRWKVPKTGSMRRPKIMHGSARSFLWRIDSDKTI